MTVKHQKEFRSHADKERKIWKIGSEKGLVFQKNFPSHTAKRFFPIVFCGSRKKCCRIACPERAIVQKKKQKKTNTNSSSSSRNQQNGLPGESQSISTAVNKLATRLTAQVLTNI